MKTILTVVLSVSLFLPGYGALAGNIAPQARITASDILDDNHRAENIADGIIMDHIRGDWACKGQVTSWGEMHLPWIRMQWDVPQKIDRIVLYDRATVKEHFAGARIRFSDGSAVSVNAIPNDGSPAEIRFPEKTVTSIQISATDGNGCNIGLSEVEVFSSRNENTEYADWVDPYIETTTGRWFYCTPAARPMGMVAAHAFTRNKNQGGGGYNYNFPEVLGFSIINDWMISGPNLMPVSGEVNPMGGMTVWKSGFSHSSEIIAPGYHRLFLDRYGVWVEYTSTDRVAVFRMKYATDAKPGLLVDVGSMLGNCSMNDALLMRVSDNEIAGVVGTTDRFWGGPDKVNLYFTLQSDRPFTSVDGWSEKGLQSDVQTIGGDESGVMLALDLDENRTATVKIGMSYTSIEHARLNLMTEASGWDFDAYAQESRNIWNEALGRIEVSGGDPDQKVKFYTDLWHVLLGRHKINDVCGTYPDYTQAEYVNRRADAKMVERQLEMNGNVPVHNMYGFDSLWLSQWNLNTLWGLAWPEILDDFSACLVTYAENGGLLPRGACAGGYSFIMTGCPSSSMLVSTYMKGLMRKTSPERAFSVMKKNHNPGGMMSYENADDLKFYIRKGYCPDNAGKTLEWAFQDWGLARMAEKMGKPRDAREFDKRSHGWVKLYHPEIGLIMPKDRKGNWLHDDPLSGRGWVEANAWQATWSLSHDLNRLASLMGGDDVFCSKLNYAFEQAMPQDFVFAYSNGYVSYANQPGCSNAHVFSYAGKPWLTQYWVRQVRQRAYSGVTPDLGYGGHDEDQGQMGAVSALMSIGLFSVTGTETAEPLYDITSPIFDKIVIHLNGNYYPGGTFTIDAYNNTPDNCYIQEAELNGRDWSVCQFRHSDFANGGMLRLRLGSEPNMEWGALLER